MTSAHPPAASAEHAASRRGGRRMRALVYESFGGPMVVRNVPAPAAAPGGVVLRVGASGICRSDWHGWQGHDPDITLPHVPGHELAGTIATVGEGVHGWQVGDRVTVPFVCACGRCDRCAAGDQQVCAHQTQPGFTHWGSFAELVAIEAADVNLVALPDELSFAVAASLGCRYGTAFRAVVHQGRVRPGEWVAVHGCGGVGLSAIQVAVAAGARVAAVDVAPGALALARELGAQAVLDSRGLDAAAVADAVRTRDRRWGAPVPRCARQSRHLRRLGPQPAGARPARPGGPAAAGARAAGRCRWTGPWPSSWSCSAATACRHTRIRRCWDSIAAGRLHPERLITRELALDEAAGGVRRPRCRPRHRGGHPVLSLPGPRPAEGPPPDH